MAFDYSEFEALAKELIDEYGRNFTLVNADQTAADPAQPWRASTDVDVSVGPFKGVVVDYEVSDTDGQNILQEDRRLLLAAVDFGVNELEDFDYVTDGSTNWRVISVNVIEPGDTRIMYDIQLRR